MTIDPATGEISGTPTTPGAYTITVTVTDAADNTATQTFTITVGEHPVTPTESTDPTTPPVVEKDAYQPVYGGNTTVVAGNTLQIAAPKEIAGKPWPQNTEFTPGTGNPDWVTVNPDGSITAAPGADVEPGKYDVQVVVTYPDGTTDTVTVVVSVLPAPTGPTDPTDPMDPTDPADPIADITNPKWNDGLINPGEIKAFPNVGDQLPAGTVVAVTPRNSAWDAGMDQNGNLVVKAPDNARPGDYTDVDIRVVYPDGTEETVTARVTVEGGLPGSGPGSSGSSGSSDYSWVIPTLVGVSAVVVILGSMGAASGSVPGSLEGGVPSTPSRPNLPGQPGQPGAQQPQQPTQPLPPSQQARTPAEMATGAAPGQGPIALGSKTDPSANRDAQLAVTGVSGVGLMLMLGLLLAALGGLLLVLRRRRGDAS